MKEGRGVGTSGGLSPDSQGSATLKSEAGEGLGEQKQGSSQLRLGGRAFA